MIVFKKHFKINFLIYFSEYKVFTEIIISIKKHLLIIKTS
jgi:hypothetical protein